MTPEESALLSDFGTQIFYQISALICTCTFYGEFKSAASFKLLSQLTQTVRRISSSSIYCILLVLVRASLQSHYIAYSYLVPELFSRRGTAGRPRKILLACLVFVLLTNTWVFVVKCSANLVEIKVALMQNRSDGDLAAQIDDAVVAILPFQYMLGWPVTLNVSWFSRIFTNFR